MDLLDQMRTFVRVVDTGRLGAAARSRNMSVAAVSRQLAALERELGATLVVRSTRQLAITESGRRWYRYCAQALSDLESARADVADSDEPQGAVVVSAPVSIALGLLVEQMEKLSRVHPKLNVELRLQDHTVDLLTEGVDIAIRVGVALPDSSSVMATRVLTFRRVLVASTSYLRRRGTPRHPRDLEEHDLLAQTRGSPSFTRWQFTRGDESVEIVPRARLRSSSPVALLEWARRGAGIALVPPAFADDCKRVMTDWLSPEITAYAVHRAETRRAARIRVVLDAVAVSMRALGEDPPARTSVPRTGTSPGRSRPPATAGR